MLFREVIGQEQLKKNLRQLIRDGHMPHAINLIGSEGSGNLPLALASAQYIMCRQRSEVDSCGSCPSCVKTQKLQHPDLHFSFPVVKFNQSIPTSKDFINLFRKFILAHPYATDLDWIETLEKDKQGNITAQECREIIQKLNLRSFESEFKILIMWYPEYLGSEGNILLKLIEEPPPKTILMFVCSNIDKLLMTIQSRTQLFPLKRLSDQEIAGALENRGMESNKAIQLARIASGNYHEALKLSEHHDDTMLDNLRAWLNALYSNNGIQLVQWVMSMSEQKKENQKKFLEFFIQLLEHALRLQLLGAGRLSLTDTEQKLLETLLKKGVTGHKINDLSLILSEAIYHLERNANSKILFHSVSLQIQKLLLTKMELAK